MKLTNCSPRPILLPCGLQNFQYQVDPYIGCEHYCYYCYVLPQAESDWSQEILIHEDISSQLEKELQGVAPQTLYLGYHSDPYQPCEEESLQTRKVLELLLSRGLSASILTKSDLVVRDMDILREMKDAAVSVSVAFHDQPTRQLFEKSTVETTRRVDALRTLNEAGIRTGALLCPVIPYITDPVQLIDMLEPCAQTIWVYGLSFQSREDENYITMHHIFLSHYPDLAEQIEQVLFSKEHTYWTARRNDLEMIKEERNLNINIHL